MKKFHLTVLMCYKSKGTKIHDNIQTLRSLLFSLYHRAPERPGDG